MRAKTSHSNHAGVLPEHRSLIMEAATLGCVMIDPATLSTVQQYLKLEDFGLDAHRLIYGAMCDRAARGESPDDGYILIKELEKRLKPAEAARVVNSLDAAVTTNSHRVAEYARFVLEAALKSARIHVAEWHSDLSKGESPEALAGLAAEEAHIADLKQRLAGEGSGSIGEWHPTVQSLADLMRKELPPVRWPVDEIIGEGATLLAAKPKKGKTVLMFQIACCIANGTKALGGHAVTLQGEVLYLALEENERRMQRRASKLLSNEPVPTGVHLVYEWPPFDRGGIDALGRWLDEHPITRLIVIDTLERIRPTRHANGSVYGEDYSAVKDIQRFANQRQVAIVVIHHTRKLGSEDPLDEVSGSTGLTGGVDNILVMRSANGIMELHRQGRDYTDNSAIALRGDPETLLWTYVGVADEVRRSGQRKEILDALKDGPKEGMSPQDLADALDKKPGAIRFLLHKMMKSDDGCIEKVNGKYVATTNSANTANANTPESPETGKQGPSQDTTRVSDTVSGSQYSANANATANAQIPLEFSAGSTSVSAVSSVSGSGKCQHVYAALRTVDGRRLCIDCNEPEARQGLGVAS